MVDWCELWEPWMGACVQQHRMNDLYLHQIVSLFQSRPGDE